MVTKLPTDANNNTIQALTLGDAAHNLSLTGSSVRTASDFADDTKIIFVHATSAFHMKLGDTGVAATTSDHRFPSGIVIPLNRDTARRAAFIKASGESDGTVHISEMQ